MSAKNKSFYVMDVYYVEVVSPLQTLFHVILNISYRLGIFGPYFLNDQTKVQTSDKEPSFPSQ